MDTPERQAPKAKQPMKNDWFKLSLGALIILAACGLSFIAGMTVQKHQQPAQTVVSANGPAGSGYGMLGGRGGARGGAIGSVTAVSAASITVQNSRTNSSVTYAIDSSTIITNNGAAATTADIKVGGIVAIQRSSSSSTTAARITINPTFGGGPTSNGQGTGASGSSSNVL